MGDQRPDDSDMGESTRRAAPKASPITGRRTLPSPTLSRLFDPLWPRPIKFSNTNELLERALRRAPIGMVGFA